MADTIVTVEENELFVTTSESQLFTASTDTSNPIAVDSLDSVGDIDISTNGKLNGSLLVYRTATNKWTSTTTLDAQNMEGGEF
jgi:hypothetical protein